ncbi:MAG: tetratricopeptide repeat protein [Candidatus Omnitrophica bacterium]|nr:tetratricopeptide repeat protein [Candidatus Omnitrophota bacterium]
MLNEKEKKTLKSFGFLYLAFLGILIFSIFLKRGIWKTVSPALSPILVLVLLVFVLYVTGFFVVFYKSAGILRKYNKTKLAPIVWLVLYFIPLIGWIIPVALWYKSIKLLKEDAGELTKKEKSAFIICSICIILFLGFYVTRGNPKSSFYSLRGLSYFMQHKENRAMLDLNKALQLNPNDARGFNVRGLFSAYKGNYDQAISDFSRAIEIDHNFSNAYINRGLAYFQKGNYEQAVSDYTKAIDLNPNYANAYINRGITYDKKESYDQAISDYTKALELSPNNALIYNNRGWVYAEKGGLEKALSDCNRAIEMNPKNANFYDSRSFTYYKKQEYGKAWDDMHKAEMLGFKPDPKFLEELKKASGREK